MDELGIVSGGGGEARGYLSLSNFSSSSVVYTFISCFFSSFNLDSMDHIAVSYPLLLDHNTKATYGASFRCGDIFFASAPKSLNFSSGTISTNSPKSSNASSNSALEILAFLRISLSCLRSSSMQNEGVDNSNISNEVISFLVVESLLKKENKTFASTTSFIYSHPLSLHLLATFSLSSRPNARHSSSVNVEFSKILSNLFRIISLASLSLTTDRTSSSSSDLVRSSSLISGIFTTISAIPTTDEESDSGCLNSLPQTAGEFTVERSELWGE